MTPMLLRSPWRGVHHYFNTGRSMAGLLGVVLIILAVLAIVLVLHRLQQHRSPAQRAGNPRKLFRTVIRRLHLSVVQRDLLRRIAADLNLDNPVLILLSPHLFAERAHAWVNRPQQGDSDLPPDPIDTLDALSRALFGTPLQALAPPDRAPSAGAEHTDRTSPGQ